MWAARFDSHKVYFFRDGFPPLIHISIFSFSESALRSWTSAIAWTQSINNTSLYIVFRSSSRYSSANAVLETGCDGFQFVVLVDTKPWLAVADFVLLFSYLDVLDVSVGLARDVPATGTDRDGYGSLDRGGPGGQADGTQAGAACSVAHRPRKCELLARGVSLPRNTRFLHSAAVADAAILIFSRRATRLVPAPAPYSASYLVVSEDTPIKALKNGESERDVEMEGQKTQRSRSYPLCEPEGARKHVLDGLYDVFVTVHDVPAPVARTRTRARITHPYTRAMKNPRGISAPGSRPRVRRGGAQTGRTGWGGETADVIDLRIACRGRCACGRRTAAVAMWTLDEAPARSELHSTTRADCRCPFLSASSDVQGSAQARKPSRAGPGLEQAGPSPAQGFGGLRARARGMPGPPCPASPGPDIYIQLVHGRS
ncbi:hypothetical protein C8R45DRAFT_1077797 [Mycena sanguinolenta]|nr:hypothetical protein C8R45DRAFT_1077797 [Mycena sanguinolenta]